MKKTLTRQGRPSVSAPRQSSVMEPEFSQAQTGDTLQAAIDGSPKMQAALQMKKAMEAGGAQHPNAVYQLMADRQGVVQLFRDGKDNLVTLAQANLADLKTLKEWEALLGNEDENAVGGSKWDDDENDEVINAIQTRIPILQAQAAHAAQVALLQGQYKQNNGDVDVANFNYDVAAHLSHGRYSWPMRIHFFAKCQGEGVDPSTVYNTLEAAAADEDNLAIALTGFMNADAKVTYAIATQIATNAAMMLAVNKDSVVAANLVTWVNNGWIVPFGGKYDADSFSFVFRFAGTLKQLNTEWHGHLGAQGKISKAHFKDQKFAHGHDAHRETLVAENQRLMTVCKW